MPQYALPLAASRASEILGRDRVPKNSDTPWRGKGGTEGMLEEIQMPVVAIMDTLELIARTGRSMKISSRQIKTNQRLLSSINAEADDYRYDGTMHLDA
jgi:hypothetical protein